MKLKRSIAIPIILLTALFLSCGDGGNTAKYEEILYGSNMQPPSAPTNLSATPSSGTQIDLSWTAATDISGIRDYGIYRGGVKVLTVSAGTAISDTGLAPLTNYCYQVSATDNAGNESIMSAQVCATTLAAPPSAPTGVAAAAATGQVTVTWAAVTGATSYNIYWSTTTGVTKLNGTKITGTTSPYTHTGRTNGTTYYYIVTAVGAGGEGAASSQVSATPAVPLPVATGKIPDTGQTMSYTTTFGEDHDYSFNTPSYTDNGNGTITDNITGLMWQKQDDATTRTWDSAGTYCSNLNLAGQTGWRLPKRMELLTIVNYGTHSPAINTTYFPGTQSSSYWSSSTYAYGTTYAWYVYFSYGDTHYYYKTNTYYVRCVRGQ